MVQFTNVSKSVLDSCISYETALDMLSKEQANILDIKCPLNQWKPVVTDDDRFAMRRITTGRDYFPTEHCLQNMAVSGRGSTWTLQDLYTDKTKADATKTLFSRDKRDAEVMRNYVNLLLFQSDRTDQDKIRLFRTWDNDNTLRAMLSKDYTVVNNGWFLKTVSRIIPNGLITHWRGDADTIYGNVLIPDTLRKEDDSDYGGLLSIGNSEIGLRRITSMPSVFRSICANGLIFGQQQGAGISQVHRKKDGKIDLDGLATDIKYHLDKQVPLLNQHIDTMLKTREFDFGVANPLNVIAATVMKMRIPKKYALGIVHQYKKEQDILDTKESRSAFAVVNAVTRFSQTLKPSEWHNMDVAAGKFASMSENQWTSVVRSAEALDKKEVEKLVGIAV